MKVDFRHFVKFVSEVFGTGMLMLYGCLGVVTSEGYTRTGTDMLFAFGFTVMLVIHIFGPISMAHINPSVTIAALILGHMKWDMALLYLVAQLIGGTVGYSILYFIVPQKYFNAGNGLCVCGTTLPINLWQIILGEFLCTSVLIFVVAAVFDKRSAQFLEGNAVRFGFLIAGLCYCEEVYTGTSMNLARSIPPLIFHKNWDNLWAYAVGQFSAVILISLIWRFVFHNPFEKEEIKE